MRVAASVTLGSLRYDQHVTGLRLRRGLLPIVDRLDVGLPRGVRVEAAAGDPVVCELDGGDGAEPTFTGTVTAVRLTLTGVEVAAHGGAHRLARLRPSLSLEQVTVADVVTRLCSDAEVDTGAVVGGPTLARYVATARSTGLDEVSRLVAFAGASAWLDETDALHAAAEPSAELALRYGREPVDVAGTSAPAPGGTFVVVGEGAGAPGSARALWPVAEFMPGSPTPGPGVRLRSAHELRTPDDARAAAEAWAARDAAARAPVRVRCWLLPGLSPGARITVADAPDDVPVATIRVRQVRHQLDPQRGAVTDVWGHDEGAAGAGLGELLGALAGAAGGLL